MPRKKKQQFGRPKRGRGRDGRGSCGRGSGGWLGRRVDFVEVLGDVEQLQLGSDDNPIYTNETQKSKQFEDSSGSLHLVTDEASKVQQSVCRGQGPSGPTNTHETSATTQSEHGVAVLQTGLNTPTLETRDRSSSLLLIETLTVQEHAEKASPTVGPHALEMPLSVKEENIAANTTVQMSQMKTSPLLLGEEGEVASRASVITEDMVARAKAKISELLPQHWIPVILSCGFNLLLLSRDKFLSTQRCINISFSGEIIISVHRIDLPEVRTKQLVKLSVTVPFRDDTLDEFVTQVIDIVKEVRGYEICAGCDYKEYEHLWTVDKNGVVDLNHFGETRYTKTYRSLDCKLLVKPSKWRCVACYLLSRKLRQKFKTHSKEMQPKTPNIYLTDAEKVAKLSKLQADLKLKNRLIDRLKVKVQFSLQADAVNVDPDLNDFLWNALKGTKVTPVQELFLQEQLKSQKVLKSSGMAWHPTMIRFALLVKGTSSAAYAAIRDSGSINLPSERTLFDYSHVVEASEGCNEIVLQNLCDLIQSFKESYQRFHSLIFDEVQISAHLVVQKSTGKIIGYTSLSEAEKEMKMLEDFVSSEVDENKWVPPKVQKVLTYMVRGIASHVKEVVASFSVDTLTSDQLYVRTWQVVTFLERAGIAIIAFICDGSAINRAFFDMHTPFTKTESGIIFDTLNLATYPRRILYFISDPPHLLKSIRNCFASSGYGPKKSRLLTINGQTIEWQSIVTLYKTDKVKTSRKCPKLNAQNVFLNSYSRMNVSYAGNVLSGTVAKALQSTGDQNLTETVNFISKTNDFFDCLNGASSKEHVRKANPLLKPYTSPDDPRFDVLLGYLKYLKDWETQVKGIGDLSRQGIERKQLSRETRTGIEITVRGFIGAVRYLLTEEKVAFINARSFCQDTFEQFFGKQSASLGGSSNPNLYQFLSNQVKIGVHKQLSVKRRSGMAITEETLPKRQRTE